MFDQFGGRLKNEFIWSLGQVKTDNVVVVNMGLELSNPSNNTTGYCYSCGRDIYSYEHLLEMSNLVTENIAGDSLQLGDVWSQGIHFINTYFMIYFFINFSWLFQIKVQIDVYFRPIAK